MNVSSTDNAVSVLARLIKELNISVTTKSVEESLKLHPEFPALSSISDVLDRWRVPNAALRLNNVKQLLELPLPFIIHQESQGGLFKLVTKVDEDNIAYWDAIKGHMYQSINDFQREWTGIVLIAEKTAESGDDQYKARRIDEKISYLRLPLIAALLGCASIFLFLLLFDKVILAQTIWISTKFIGTVISVLLLSKQYGRQSSFIDRLCRISTKSDCKSILDSKAADLSDWIKWTDIGTVYFFGGLLVAMSGTNPVLNWMAIAAAPYITFSIYYQARVARVWCPLCLGVQFVLLVEAGMALTTFSATIEIVQVQYFFMAFSLVSAGWLLIRPVLVNARKHDQNYEELIAFKRNPDIFNSLQLEQEEMLPLPTHLQPVRLLQRNTEHTITIVSNPYCGPCALQHKELDAFLLLSPSVNVDIIFLTSDTVNDKITILTKHLLMLDSNEVHAALSAWFDQVHLDYETWKNQFPVSDEKDQSKAYQMAIEHGVWCWNAGIQSTPTVFLNGRRLSDLYRLTEIVWFLENESTKQGILS